MLEPHRPTQHLSSANDLAPTDANHVAEAIPTESTMTLVTSTSNEHRPTHRRYASALPQIPIPSPRLGLSELLSYSPSTEPDSYFASSLTANSDSRSTLRDRDHSPSSSSCARLRSPRIQNAGGILAPHGTFTSAHAKQSFVKSSSSQTSSRSDGSVSRLALADVLPPEEREILLRAATKGDQLAMYRLGWSSERKNTRHMLGAVQDVWGPIDGSSTSTHRSSQSSRTALSSPAGLTNNAIDTRRGSLEVVPSPTRKPPGPDLFDDAARLAFHASAYDRMPRRQSLTPGTPSLKGGGQRLKPRTTADSPRSLDPPI